MNDFVVKQGIQLGGSVKGSVGTVTGNATLDLSTGDAFEVVPTADVTFAFSNPPAAGNAKSFSVALTGADVGATYDIANAVYDSVSFSVAGQDINPTGVFFKPDGTKMYMSGQSGNDINEYSLSTAWDITTASYVQNFSVSAQEADPNGLLFKPDGTKMFIVGQGSDAVNEYNLSSAWDISSATFVQSFSISAQEGLPNDLFFRPDGTKMYVIGDIGNDINEYNLSTAWDISTASYVQSFNILSQDSSPTGLFFTPDGLRMFTAGYVNDNVNLYNLATAWDISTASYSLSFSVSGQETTPFGISFKPDGTKMYVVGWTNATVYQYSTGSLSQATITYPSSVVWSGGTAPTTPADGVTDLLTFYTEDGGNTYYGFKVGEAMA